MPKKNASQNTEEIETPEDDAIANFYARIDTVQGAATVRVARFDARSGLPATLTEYDAGEFDVMQLARDHGGGKYRLQLVDGRTKQIITSHTHEIDRSVKPQRNGAAAGGSGDDAQPASTRELILQMQLEFERRTVEMLRKQPAQSQAMTPTELIAMLNQAQQNTIAMMTAAMGNRSSLTDTIETMKAMKDFVGDGLGGGGGEGDGWGSAIKAVLTILPQLAAQAPPPAAQPGRAQLPPGAAPAPTAPTSPGAPPPTPPAMTDEQKLQRKQENAVRAVAAIIMAGSNAQAEADDYAGPVWDTLEQAGVDVPALLSVPNETLLDQLTERMPALQPHRAFTGAVLDAMRADAAEPETGEPNAATPGNPDGSS